MSNSTQDISKARGPFGLPIISWWMVFPLSIIMALTPLLAQGIGFDFFLLSPLLMLVAPMWWGLQQGYLKKSFPRSLAVGALSGSPLPLLMIIGALTHPTQEGEYLKAGSIFSGVAFAAIFALVVIFAGGIACAIAYAIGSYLQGRRKK